MGIKSSDKIRNIVYKDKKAKAVDIARKTGLSKQSIHKHLNVLTEEGSIQKIGRPPSVWYIPASKKPRKKKRDLSISSEERKTIDKHFFYITPRGEALRGVDAFIAWCNEISLSTEKMAPQYVELQKSLYSNSEGSLINGTNKLRKTFDNVHVDKMYYIDFYSIEIFGKTKLGQMLLYAKQSQNRELTRKIAEQIRHKVQEVIKRHSIEAVVFVPPTVKREIQFMKELEEYLSLDINTVKVEKIKTPITIPQKTLNKLVDRISNAELTFVVTEKNKYPNVLLIDDAVGSGATMNAIAQKLKESGTAQKVFGLAVTGSRKGFEVISEV